MCKKNINDRVIIFLLLFYLLCALHNWGATLGYESRGGSFSAGECYREAFVPAVLGPMWVIQTIYYSNMYKYGFIWK